MARTKKNTSTVPVKLPDASKSIFKSTSKVLPKESDEIKIGEAIDKAEREKKEIDLLSHELKKPASSRNQALMRKYQTQATSGSIDNYPVFGKDKFKIFVQLPEDPSVPLEHRPEPWAITVVINHNGNEFQFAFPISRAGNVNPNVVYKLDNFPNVYTDIHGDVDTSVSEYSLYEALLDYKNNNRDEIELMLTILKNCGALKKDGRVDFRIRNQGFLVTFTKLKTEKKVSDSTVINIGKVYILKGLEVIGDHDTAEKIKFDLKHQPGFKLAGLKDGEFLGGNDVVGVKAIITKKGFTSGKYHIIIEDLVDGILGAVVVNGPALAKDRFKTNGRESELIKVAEKLNRELYDEYIDTYE
jgi:hypothetical protein